MSEPAMIWDPRTPPWHVIKAAADFDGNTVADVLLQNDNGLLAIWELQNTATTGPQFLPNGQFNIGQNPGPTWHAVAAGDFNGDGRAGILFRCDLGDETRWAGDWTERSIYRTSQSPLHGINDVETSSCGGF